MNMVYQAAFRRKRNMPLKGAVHTTRGLVVELDEP
jgi:hypothetical protein